MTAVSGAEPQTPIRMLGKGEEREALSASPLGMVSGWHDVHRHGAPATSIAENFLYRQDLLIRRSITSGFGEATEGGPMSRTMTATPKSTAPPDSARTFIACAPSRIKKPAPLTSRRRQEPEAADLHDIVLE